MKKSKDLVLIETLMKCYGLWPDQSENVRKIIFFLHQLFMVSLLLALGAGLADERSTKISIIYQNLICMAYLSGGTIKYMILFIKRDQIKELYDQFLSDCKNMSDDRTENKLLKASVNKGYLINRILLIYGFPAFVIIGCLSLYLKSPGLLQDVYSDYFPYYYRKIIISEDYHYQLVSLHITIVFISTTFCYFMTSVIFVVVTTNVCGLFAIARHRLENVLDIPDDESIISSLESIEINHDDRIITNLKNVIKKHNEAIEMVKKIELTFSSVTGVVQIAALGCFAISMYDVLCYSGTNQQLLRSMVLLSVYISYVYILNWTGQEVSNVCDAFFTSCYTIQWYELPPKAKNLLLIIQLRASKSEMLTAAPVFILSIDNFSWILRTSWSITAVLKSSRK